MYESLRGLTAIITGAGTGIGEATPEDLAAARMCVAVVGRRAGLVDALAGRIRAAGGVAVSETG
jgi:NADP-dependent 3-hydroxy acid dehydrogenase YdfG